jgi:hypothetical protein
MWKVTYYFFDVRNLGLRWRDDSHPATDKDRSLGRWLEETFETEEDARRAAADCDEDKNCSQISVSEKED